MVRLHKTYGFRYFFGADDNFFNDRDRTIDILQTISWARKDRGGKRLSFRWGTEVTVHDAQKMIDDMRLVRSAGIRALWLGVEDMTATLVKKGQSVDKTTEVFKTLRRYGIAPMPMMMHHDTQPLITRGDRPYGLLNQVKVLRKAGAVSLQVLMITPATGSRTYEEAYQSRLLYRSAGGRPVEVHMLDGNYVVASRHPHPWKKQLNLIAAYAYFYNPLRLAWALIRPKSRLYLADAGVQVIGMWGLTQTVRRTLGWAVRLMRGNLVRSERSPASVIPMRSPDGQAASHALPGTPGGSPVQLTVSASSAGS